MDDDFFAGGDLFDDDVAFSSIADAAASQPDLSILSLSAQFGDDKKLIKRSHTVSHTSDSWKSLTSTLPIYDQSLSPADLLASSQLLFAVTNLSVARAFAGEIFDNGALPHITSYIPTTLPPSPIPAPHLACIINAIAAVRNLACAHRHVRDAVRETGTCDRILVLLRESTDDQPNDDIACAALGALRNVTHSCKETTNRLTSLGVIPLLQSLLSSESKLARRESLFRACGTLVNICECEPDAANEFVNCDRPKLVAFRAVSDLNVGKIEDFEKGKNHCKPLHKGYISILACVGEGSGDGDEWWEVSDELRLFIERANEVRAGDKQFREKRSKAAKQQRAKAKLGNAISDSI